LCNRRDARAESHTHAKRMIVRKKLSAKSNTFALNEIESTYRLFSAEPGQAQDEQRSWIQGTIARQASGSFATLYCLEKDDHF